MEKRTKNDRFCFNDCIPGKEGAMSFNPHPMNREHEPQGSVNHCKQHLIHV